MLKYSGMRLRDKNYIDMETKRLLYLGIGYNHFVQVLLLKNVKLKILYIQNCNFYLLL
jgi:hypothetical protein